MTGASGRPAIRVLIADDQRVVRDGLTMLVALIDGVEVAGSMARTSLPLATSHTRMGAPWMRPWKWSIW